MMYKCYSEMLMFDTFEERYNYLKLNGAVGADTFGFDRYANQALYKSKEWKRVRDQVILRDNGCDLGVEGYEIAHQRILIHHIIPITMQDILERNPIIFDLDNLITVTHRTHNAIHYGDSDQLILGPTLRSPNDTCPWRK